MTLRRPSCNGLPDCNPPNGAVIKLFSAFVVSLIIFYAAEYYSYQLTNPEASWFVLSVFLSSIIVAILFICIFLEWVRRPRSSPGWQKGGNCVEQNCDDNGLTPRYRNRDLNALLFGLVLGLLFIIPRIVNYGEGLLWENLFRLLAFVMAALVIRLILKMDEEDKSPETIHIIFNWYKPYLERIEKEIKNNPVKK